MAVGVNCCAPEDFSGAVEIAARVTGKSVVVHPDSGEAWNAEVWSWRGVPHPTPVRSAGGGRPGHG